MLARRIDRTVILFGLLIVAVILTGWGTDYRSCQRQEALRVAAESRAQSAQRAAGDWHRYADQLRAAGRQLDADHAERIAVRSEQRKIEEGRIRPLECGKALPDTSGIG